MPRSSPHYSSGGCGWWCRGFLAFFLKFLNFLQSFVGVCIIIYSLWMLNQWNMHRPIPGPPSALPPTYDSIAFQNSAILPSRSDAFAVPEHVLSRKLGVQLASGVDDVVQFNFNSLPSPWFIYLFLGIGILVCLVTCVGYIAAEAVNGCCLCSYTMLMSTIIVVEAALVGFIAFSKHWDEDLPFDPTGEFDRLRSFIKDNIDVCKWVGLAVITIQGLSLLLSMILRAMVSSRRENYDSDDDDYSVVRGGRWQQPLLNSKGGQTSASTSVDDKGVRAETWSTRMREKVSLF